ncbi:hypothetical protein C0992_012141 [Termitomyces sp. T32_za158]|nr:hypothetical protein C0992_012141 [Termitomyces sp. T32_za158]
MADSSEQPPGFLEPPSGSTPHEMLSVSKYQPPPKQDDRLTCNMSKSFGMPGGLSVSQMKAILNPGSKPGDKSFASGLSLPATNLLSLIYQTLPKDNTFTSGALGEPVQYTDTTQGSALMHSTPFGTAQPEHGAKLGTELLSDQMTQYQGASLATVTGHGTIDKGKAPDAPSVVDDQVDSGTQPPSGNKGPREVAIDLVCPAEAGSGPFSNGDKGVNAEVFTALHELFTRIYELELNEYIKCKLARRTATLTATPAESVDYNAVLRQCKPNIAEAMDMLNAPQQANESQQDFERWQNAARRQANTSGMPHWALLEVETATSYHAGDEEVEEPPEMRTPHRRVTIKEEECEESVPDDPVTPRCVA